MNKLDAAWWKELRKDIDAGSLQRRGISSGNKSLQYMQDRQTQRGIQDYARQMPVLLQRRVRNTQAMPTLRQDAQKEVV